MRLLANRAEIEQRLRSSRRARRAPRKTITRTTRRHAHADDEACARS